MSKAKLREFLSLIPALAALAGLKPVFADIDVTFTQIDYPNHTNGVNTTATAINNLGQIVGFYQGPEGPSGFVLSAGSFHL